MRTAIWAAHRFRSRWQPATDRAGSCWSCGTMRAVWHAQDASADDAEDTVPFGVGQIGIRERIHQLGGRLALRPAVPSGTVVEGWLTIDLDLGPRRGAATAAGFCREPRLSRRARRYQASAFETAGISEERQRQGRGQRTGFRCRPA